MASEALNRGGAIGNDRHATDESRRGSAKSAVEGDAESQGRLPNNQ